jgi:hypothetical protein
MHQITDQPPIISGIQFGFDAGHLFVRVDGLQPMRSHFEAGIELRIRFLKPAGRQIVLQFDQHRLSARLEERQPGGDWAARDDVDLRAAVGQIVEVGIAFDSLGVSTRDTVAFFVGLGRSGRQIEHQPRQVPIEIQVPGKDFEARNWRA